MPGSGGGHDGTSGEGAKFYSDDFQPFIGNLNTVTGKHFLKFSSLSDVTTENGFPEGILGSHVFGISIIDGDYGFQILMSRRTGALFWRSKYEIFTSWYSINGEPIS